MHEEGGSEGRVRLVPLEPRHLSQTQAWANTPALQSRMLRFLPVTELDQKRWYGRLCKDPSRVVFAIENVCSDEHVGNAGLYYIDSVNRRAEFWILLGASTARGQGLGKEAIEKVVAYGFNSLNLNRVYLHVDQENTVAVNAYAACGFVREGVLREHCYIAGRYLDILVMSVLRKDYDRGQVE